MPRSRLYIPGGSTGGGGGGGGGFEEVIFHIVTAPEAVAKSFSLPLTPLDVNKVFVDVEGGSCALVNATDYNIVGTNFNWGTFTLDGVLLAGDIVRLGYDATTAIGFDEVFFHTVTAPEAAAKSFPLPSLPGNVNRVFADIEGGVPAQVNGTDYNIVGLNFNWTGFNLDGVLLAGDVVRFGYDN
jgi:hypothetical protein